MDREQIKNYWRMEEEARREKVKKNFNLEKSLLAFIDKKYPEGEKLVTPIRKEFIQAIHDKGPFETLKELEHSLDVYISYWGEKLRDTEEQQEYLEELELMHEELLKLIENL